MGLAIEAIILSAVMLTLGFFGSGYIHRLRHWHKEQNKTLRVEIQSGKKTKKEELEFSQRVSVKTIGGQLFTLRYQAPLFIIVTVESGAEIERPDMNRVVEL